MTYYHEINLLFIIMDKLYSYTILEPLYTSSSHLVSTFAKNGDINYFDSFGMPPFQKIVNHAKKNLTLLHHLSTKTCGYFCLYFLKEMNKGTSYCDLLKVFDINNAMYNEIFAEDCFKKFLTYTYNEEFLRKTEKLLSRCPRL